MAELNFPRPGYPGSTPQDSRIIRVAIVASLLLHVVLVAATWKIPFKPGLEDLPPPDPAREIELILEPDLPESPAESNKPTTYVSVPERQAAEQAPEDPDYLALYHSVAADNLIGDTQRPSADEEGQFEAVRIQKEELAGAGGVEYSPQPDPEKPAATTQRESGAEGSAEAAAQGDRQPTAGSWALPEEQTETGGQAEGSHDDDVNDDSPRLEDWWGGQENPSILKQGAKGGAGDRGFEFDQKATGKVTSGVAVNGEFRLNTEKWDWAPWIQVFSNELHRHWVPPYAYRLGLIKGTTVIRLVVEKDGRPSSMNIIDEDGHESLHDASLAALKAFAPYLPLPAHFPEENLVITLSLHYPAFRR